MEDEKRDSVSKTEETEALPMEMEMEMEMESSPLRGPARYHPAESKPFSPPQSSPPPPENPNLNPPSRLRFYPKEKKPFSPPLPPPLEKPQSPVQYLPVEKKTISPSQPPPPESPVRVEKKPFSPPQPPQPENTQNLVRYEKKPFSPPQPTQPENTQTPVRYEKKPFTPSQLRPPLPPPPESPQSKALVTVDRGSYGFSNIRSPPEQKKYLTPPETPHESVPVKPSSPVIVVNRSIREELSVMSKMDNGEDDDYSGGRREDVENGNDRKPRALSSILRKERKVEMVKRAALGFRICALVFCLISFSVMAADRTQGWAGDSFDRYKEYRYCISVNIIGFAYAGFQAYDLAYSLVTEKHVIPRFFGYYFDFSMDQIMTYLLISASSSAATRVDDWVTNWGKDEFTQMATASIGMSFMAFFAFAVSSLISGYNLCTRNYQY